MLDVVHTAARIGQASFGVGPVVLNLTKHQRLHGAAASVWCLDSRNDANWALSSCGLAAESAVCFRHLGPGFLGYSPQMERAAIRSQGATFDIMHQHGIWTALSRVTNRWRAKYQRPTVITPHGSLEPWAIKKSARKKRIALTVYEHQNLRQASCLHALAQSEAISFRTFGLPNPIAVIPNGISEAWLDGIGNGDRFREEYGIPADVRVFLFLGRVTPKKGLPMLVEAVHAHRERLADWRLVIAGADEFGHQAEVQAQVKRLSLEAYIQFVGPVFDQNKRDAYAAAEFFVLSSYSEGAPITVLEALGAGVPVLASRGSPWEDLVTYGCGWWPAPNSNAIGQALICACETPTSELRQMGLRGKALVSERYTWMSAAEMTLSLYGWLRGQNSIPDFVLTS